MTASTPASTRSARASARATSSGTTAAACRAASRPRRTRVSRAAPATASVRGPWTGDLQSFIFPFDLFHGGIPGGNDCAPAGVPGGCGHLVGGTTRVWETIAGGNATMNTASWYVTNNPSNQNMTKGSLGNRSFINQVKYSPKWSSVADRSARTTPTTGSASTSAPASPARRTGSNVTGGNTVLPNRPVLGVAVDPSSPDVGTEVGYAAVGGFNANTPTPARPRLPGVVQLELRVVQLARQERQPAGHPGRLGDREPELPAAGLRGNRLRALLHERHHRRVADVVALRQRPAARDDLGPADRPRVDDAVDLDARPRRLRVAAAERAGQAEPDDRLRPASRQGRTATRTSRCRRRRPRACRSRSSRPATAR